MPLYAVWRTWKLYCTSCHIGPRPPARLNLQALDLGNLNKNGDPSYLEVKMTGGCGDQVLNGQPTGGSARYTMWVWVKQPTGKFYGRPGVKTFFRTSKGQRWLRGDVPTGGYVDQMWLRAEQRDGQSQLHVFIKHQSLDSKPSSQSEYWFSKRSS